jgi:hypothetical protein
MLHESGLELDVRFSLYNQIFQEFLSPTNLLATNTGGIDVVLVRVEDFVREIADLAKARTLIQRTVEQLSEPVYLQADSFRSVIKSASERDGYVGAGTLRTRST